MSLSLSYCPFKIRDGLVPSINTSVINRIMKKIKIDEESKCVFWLPKRTTISYGKEKEEQIKRLIFFNCVDDLKPKERVYQTCQHEIYKRCIQPLHLKKQNCCKESDEWKKEKKRKRHDTYEKKKSTNKKKLKVSLELELKFKIKVDFYSNLIIK